MYFKKLYLTAVSILLFSFSGIAQTQETPAKEGDEQSNASTAPAIDPQQLQISLQVLRLTRAGGTFVKLPNSFRTLSDADKATSVEVQRLGQEDDSQKLAAENRRKHVSQVKQEIEQDKREAILRQDLEIQQKYLNYLRNLRQNLPQKGNHKNYTSYNNSFKPITRK